MNRAHPSQIIARLNNRVRSPRAKIQFLDQKPFGDQLVFHRYRLGNGLLILILVDRSAQVLSYHTWFRVGSRHEKKGKTGLAHLFEHLMFNETQNLPAGMFDRILEAAGGETNAATWVDWTYYYANLPSSELSLIIQMEADRMTNLVLRDPLVMSEKEVVANERRFRVDDDVEGAVSEQLYRTCFEHHPYGNPTIGWMEDIQAFTTQDCERFYQTYYAPNNALVVIVGDLDEERALALVQDFYGPIRAARLPVHKQIQEPKQRTERRLRLFRSTPSEKIQLGYRIPAFGHPDYIALTLANEILFGGRSSRLYERLVRDREIAAEARGSLTPFQEPGLYEIWISLRQGKQSQEALKIVQQELKRLSRETLRKEELDKVINRLELGFMQGIETVGGKAEKLGFYETVLGDASLVFDRLEAIRNISAKQIREVARRYFTKSSRTMVTVIPMDGVKP